MPTPRRLNKTTSQKHELEAFAEKYDTYADIYGDPVERVFRIMSDSTDADVQLAAARTLMAFRYPQVKAAEGAGAKAPVLNFNVSMPAPKEIPANETPAKALTLVVRE